MQKITFLLSFFILSALLAVNIPAQQKQVGIRKNLAGGEVKSVGADKIVLQTADGEIDVIVSEATEFKRVKPENPTLKDAGASNIGEVGVGDKLLVTGLVADNKKSMPAKVVYILTKADIAQKQTNDQEQWRTRGISGKITAINPQTKEITITMPGLMGAKSVILTPKPDAKFMRYAPDSVNFNEAKTSTFTELAIGDSIRAIGDKSEDGATFKAEQVLSGAFQTVAGTITAINLEKGEITVNNIQTKKDVVIVVGRNTILKQFPADVAQRMAQMQANGGGNTMRPPTQTQNTAQNPQQNQTQGGGQNRGGGSLDEMLERFPTITIANLKVGEMIAVSSTKSTNLERVTAIKLLSGVEPFLKMAQTSGGGGSRQGGGANSGFSIPGLDGAGFP